MNQGFFGIQYGEAIRPYRVNFRINPGSSQYAGEALVIGCTDFTSPTLVSRGSGAPTFNVPHYVLQLPCSVGRVGQAPTAVAPLCVQIPNGGITGGNARGVGAVDLQATRTAATQVASGANSFAGGVNSTASGQYSFVYGSGCSATGTASFAVGATAAATNNYAVAIGQFVSAGGLHALAYGNGATSAANMSVGFHAVTDRSLTSFNWSTSQRAASGDRNKRKIDQCAVTTNATATVLTTTAGAESTTNTWVIPNNFGGIFTGWILARNTANNDQIAWRFEGMVTRDASAATVALLGTVTPTAVGTADAGMSACTLAVGVNTTNGSVIVTATGIAATTIHWNGWIDCAENG